MVSPARSAVGCGAAKGHRFGDNAADVLGGNDQVIVGEVGIAGGDNRVVASSRGPISPCPAMAKRGV